MLGHLSTSASIVGIAHTLSLKKSRTICILIVFPSLKRTAPSQRTQIIASMDMLDEVLDEMLGHLNTSPNIYKICWLICWVKCWIFKKVLSRTQWRIGRHLSIALSHASANAVKATAGGWSTGSSASLTLPLHSHMSSARREGSEYHFKSLWYDSAGARTHDLPGVRQTLYHWAITPVRSFKQAFT